MWYNFIFGFISIVGIMAIWAFIQHKWKDQFSEEYTDEDVLSHRSDCSSCGNCANKCASKN